MRAIILLPLLLAASAIAQQVVIDPVADDPLQLRFDPGFIARNGITAITGEGLVKRDDQPMRDKNERFEHRFAANGLPTTTRISRLRKGGVRDTSDVAFHYDPNGCCVKEVRHDLTGAYALLDSLDAEKRCLRRTYARLPHADSVNGSCTLISDEHYRYRAVNDTASERTWLNDQGLPYRTRTFSKDGYGYLRQMEDHYLITGRRGRVTLRYSEKGRPYERLEQADLNDPSTSRVQWRYDNAGNVVSCDQYRNERRIRHAEYLYEEGTMFLKAIITKDEETGMIHVVRYTTQRR